MFLSFRTTSTSTLYVQQIQLMTRTDGISDLELLAIHPSFQGQGLASKLLKWGLSRADEEGVEVFLTSSPDGRRLYERNGFGSKDFFSPFPGYDYWSMIRPAQQ